MIHAADIVWAELLGLELLALAAGYNRAIRCNQQSQTQELDCDRYHAVRAYMCVRCCVRTALLLCGVALEIALRDCIQSNWGVALGGVCFGVCVWSGDRDRH